MALEGWEMAPPAIGGWVLSRAPIMKNKMPMDKPICGLIGHRGWGGIG